MRTSVVWMAMVAMVLIAAGCGSPTTEAPPAAEPSAAPAVQEGAPAVDAAALAKAKCAGCHGYDRVENYAGDTPWKETVQRMIDQNEAKIEAADAAKIVAYLEATFPL